MKRHSFILFACLGVILLGLASCNLGSGTAVPPTTAAQGSASTEPASATPTEETAVIETPAGTVIHWWDGSDFVYVPAGTFTMGDANATTGDDTPAHQVSLGSYWIQQTEVTNRMYAQCVALGICLPPVQDAKTPFWYTDPAYGNNPVVGVNWEGAAAYCNWISARLPSEAEWEMAARGTENYPYPWGQDDPTCQRGDYAGCLPKSETIAGNAYPGGRSPFGAADMVGNAFEWVSDWYGDTYYASSPAQNPAGPDTATKRVFRSSSYLSKAAVLPVYLRSSLEPDKTQNDLGFRCVLTGESINTPPPPLCNVLSYTPIDKYIGAPGAEVQNPPPFALEVYCNTDKQNQQYGTAAIILDPSVEPGQVNFSSPNGALNCNQDSNNQQQFNCSGSAFQPGKSVTISTCYASPPDQPVLPPVCPIYYTFIPNTGMCEYGTMMPVQCAAPNVAIPGYGCLPAPQNGDCPNAYYAGTYDNKPVCIPAHGPACMQGQQGGTICPAVCPEGLVFNEGNFCCDYPPGSVEPVCPIGYSYNANAKACTADFVVPPACTTITTLVPTCQLDACLITSTSNNPSGMPVTTTTCVSPCPVGVGNGGACTP